MSILRIILTAVALFMVAVSGFSVIESGRTRVSRVQSPIAMGLFDNILGQKKSTTGRL